MSVTYYRPARVGDRVLVRMSAAARTTEGGLLTGPDTFEPGTVAYTTIKGNIGVYLDDATISAQPIRVAPDRVTLDPR